MDLLRVLTICVCFCFLGLTCVPGRYALTIVIAPVLAERIRGSWFGDVFGLPRLGGRRLQEKQTSYD